MMQQQVYVHFNRLILEINNLQFDFYRSLMFYIFFFLQIDIPQHHIQLWPGYTTSIRQHETDILMCAEIGTKLMRTETVFDILQRLHGSGGNWQHQFISTVVGSTILTRYNNKTYRIDDVDFTSNPSNTFDTKDGPKRYLDYYREVSFL